MSRAGFCRCLFADPWGFAAPDLRLILSGVLHQLFAIWVFTRGPARLAEAQLPGPGQRVVNFCPTI